jgi:hypothetical protein
MPDVVVGHIEDLESLEPVFSEFERHHPGFKIGCGHFDSDDGQLVAEYGGVRYIWIDRGEGEVFLDSGYRTQEGDGESLPPIYESDQCDNENWSILQTLAENLDTLHERIRPPVEAILDRISERTLVGDIANEIWLMEESEVPREKRANRPKVRRTFDLLLENYSTVGWSTKQMSSFEPIQVGDQLAALDDEPVRVRGKFYYWWIENTNIFMTHLTTARRLRYLRDTAGGCNSESDAFRRLTMTWHCNTATADEADGINTVNSHVVNIAAQTSRTHYHPAIPVGGGKPQHEIYFVLNPSVYSLNADGRQGYLHVFPDISNLTVYQQIPLSPGAIVYIPPDTGHRAVDAFVNVVTLPGFKPHNEIDLDAQIKETTNGSAPYNEHLLHR